MKEVQRPLISAIVAMAENHVIGKNNQLPWHLPADLKHFKALTTGHPILMGRKTYESIGKPLANRSNLIMTRNPTLTIAGCIMVQSLDEAVQQTVKEKNNELFIIGGAAIYQQCLPYINRIYLTLVHHIFDGDTYFPELNKNEWQEIERERHEADDKNQYAYSFIELIHRSPKDSE